MRTTMEFIRLVKAATLENTDIDEETKDRLRNPVCEQLSLDDKDLALSIELYLATENASRAVYEGIRSALLRDSPTRKILSHAELAAKRLTGISSMKDDITQA
ncbi:hypothetical protein C8Q80DRAFT_291727 [Daedaleopsis nitida]|nr:hypothetical protein C8Q80DRAFT_291727 [Daedaleopsis nitida]